VTEKIKKKHLLQILLFLKTLSYSMLRAREEPHQNTVTPELASHKNVAAPQP
jgi:hypothetical protein